MPYKVFKYLGYVRKKTLVLPGKTNQKRTCNHTWGFPSYSVRYHLLAVTPSPVRAGRLARFGGSAMAWRSAIVVQLNWYSPLPPSPNTADSTASRGCGGAAGSPQNIAPLLYIVTYRQSDGQTLADTAAPHSSLWTLPYPRYWVIFAIAYSSTTRGPRTVTPL